MAEHLLHNLLGGETEVWTAKRRRLGASKSATAVVALLVIAAAVACSGERQPPDAERLTAPPSGELRYVPVDGQICEQIGWDGVASRFGIGVGEVSATSGRNSQSSTVRCELTGIEAEYLDQRLSDLNLTELNLKVFDGPEAAETYYDDVLLAAGTRFGEPVTRGSDGWWTKGTVLEGVRSARSGFDGSVVYHVHHQNLYLNLSLTAHGMDNREAVANLHDLAGALLDDVKAHLRCRSLVGQPTTECA